MEVAGGDSTHLDPCPRPARRIRARDESGNIFVLFAVLVPVFILMVAVVVDVGYWWVNARKAQTAADACALAAAGDPQFRPLTDGRYIHDTAGKYGAAGEHYYLEHCRFGAPEKDYASTNLHLQSDPAKSIWHKSTVVKTPYKGNNTRVEATVEIRVNTFFGTYVGLDYVDITRRAVAEVSSSINEVAIHAHTTNCDADALVINGKNINVTGIVESNGDFIAGGENIKTGPATGFHGGNCKIEASGPGLSFGGQPKPTHDPTPNPWPYYVVPGEHPFDWPNNCDVVGQNIIFDTKNEVIPPGIYCASESFEVKNEGISGAITVFSPRINIGGKNTRFTPSPQAMAAGKPLLFMHLANGTADQSDDDPEPVCNYNHKMELNAEGIIWTGVLFSPCGHININGALNAALDGMIVAQSVRINGENFNLKKLDVAGMNKRLALWE